MTGRRSEARCPNCGRFVPMRPEGCLVEHAGPGSSPKGLCDGSLGPPDERQEAARRIRFFRALCPGWVVGIEYERSASYWALLLRLGGLGFGVQVSDV